ncbi:M24 family metallopeptidase [Amycolatopsis magusensis]|uniref:Xaa-Pro dipeptidase n=1 Tax=Amycolatopsis magusensis TaxID=882444 RepID=A0ABS4PZK1_9PSEU|nr:Xaa-Pro peptidase family protein [Amycolatopsis magusensis]MBP2184860.1 Xaa-Pro dipeptidase [Amycolatopsis magusensis]
MRDNENLPFELSEYQRRLAVVREGMAERGIDLALVSVPENIYYLTGYTTLGYYMYQTLLVPIDGEPLLLTYIEEKINIERLSWLERFVNYGVGEDPIEVTARTVASLGVAGKTLSIEESGYFFPVRTYRRLVAELSGVTWVDGSGLVESCRLIKSPAEIAYIRGAANAAMAGMVEALATARIGATENQVAAAVYRATLDQGSEYPGSPPYVISGERSGLPHGTWEGRELRENDIVFLEFSGCVKRYSAAMMRTAFLGDPPACVADRATAVIDGLQHAIDAIAPGATSGSVDEACRKAMLSHGFGDHTHETGYSIGVCYPPGWNESHIMNLHPGDETVLRPNMVFHLVPSLIVPELNGHVGFSETVAVTETGCEVLTDKRVPRQLQLLPTGGR